MKLSHNPWRAVLLFCLAVWFKKLHFRCFFPVIPFASKTGIKITGLITDKQVKYNMIFLSHYWNCTNLVSDLAQHYLMRANITAIRRVRKTDNNRIARSVLAPVWSLFLLCMTWNCSDLTLSQFWFVSVCCRALVCQGLWSSHRQSHRWAPGGGCGNRCQALWSEKNRRWVFCFHHWLQRS